VTAARTRPTFAPYAAVAIAACTWGTWPLILHRADAIAPTHAALKSAVVMAVATVVSAIVMLRDRVAARATLKDWLLIGWLGVGDAGNIVLFFKAYEVTSVAIAVLTHYLTPIFVAIAAPIFLRERGSARGFVAVGLSFAGLVLLLGPWRASAGAGAHDVLGAILGAASAVCYASNVMVNKRLAGVFSTSELMFFHGLVATPLLALLVPPSAWSAIDAGAMLVVVGGAIGPGAIAGLLFVYGLRKMPANHASTLTLLEPLIAVVLGAMFLGETMTAIGIAGGLLILTGAFLVVFFERAQRSVSP
jgi:drug/metabolite transporter (DMT)-like permease